ncbi:hypothetical protein PMAYCL1PPCAC_02118, partial [Pristionchus mayeri]
IHSFEGRLTFVDLSFFFSFLLLYASSFALILHSHRSSASFCRAASRAVADLNKLSLRTPPMCRCLSTFPCFLNSHHS